MTRDKFINQAISHYKELWLLSDWEVKWKYYKSLPPNDGVINVLDYGLKQAEMGLPSRGPRKILETSIEHELIHLVLWPENRVFDPIVEKRVAPKMKEAIWDAYNRSQNEIIGALQRARESWGIK